MMWPSIVIGCLVNVHFRQQTRWNSFHFFYLSVRLICSTEFSIFGISCDKFSSHCLALRLAWAKLKTRHGQFHIGKVQYGYLCSNRNGYQPLLLLHKSQLWEISEHWRQFSLDPTAHQIWYTNPYSIRINFNWLDNLFTILTINLYSS